MYHPFVFSALFVLLFKSVAAGNGAATTTLTELCDVYEPNGYYDEDLGRVKLDVSIYCTALTLRAVPRYTCCTPEPPTPAIQQKESNVSTQFPNFFLFPPQNQSQSLKVHSWLNWRQEEPGKSLLAKYDRVVYLIHGWNENLWTSVWLNRTIRAWVGPRKTPVIVVDWSAKNKKFSQTVANAVTVGKTAGFSMIKWNIIDKVDLVGHSAGGQVVGEVANYVKEKGLMLRHCVVLDPAGPGFDTGDDRIRISKDDCKLVQAIHSSSPHIPLLGVIRNKYGTFHKVGSCDYYINCGNDQGSDCKDPKPHEKRSRRSLTELQKVLQVSSRAEDESFCSHHRAPLVYASQVSKNCSFSSYRCRDCSSLRLSDNCSYEEKVVGTLPPDNKCNPSDDLSFYVPTLSKYPYC